jgi:hypothetical protein
LGNKLINELLTLRILLFFSIDENILPSSLKDSTTPKKVFEFMKIAEEN